MVDEFWSMVKSWPPLGQGLFFLSVVAVICNLLKSFCYYITVADRGWPPSPNVVSPDLEDEDDEVEDE